MKNTIIASIIVAVGIFAGVCAIKPNTIIVKEYVRSPLSHRQQVWLGALEWCESRGDGEAINKKDKDGTPSYYWLQFKPGTFRLYGEKYGLIEKGLSNGTIMLLMKEYGLTKKIAEKMVQDPDVKWNNEFPGCVKKLGEPPQE